MDYRERIAIDPDIVAGKPVIKGTRLTVECVLNWLAQGWDTEEILRNYPGPTHEDIVACQQYIAKSG